MEAPNVFNVAVRPGLNLTGVVKMLKEHSLSPSGSILHLENLLSCWIFEFNTSKNCYEVKFSREVISPH